MSEIADRIKAAGAIKKGKFKLSNGSLTDYYIDKYVFETQPDVLEAITTQIAAQIDTDEVDVIAGPELGAVPLVTAVSLRTGIPCAFIRKGQKHYGTQLESREPSRKANRLPSSRTSRRPGTRSSRRPNSSRRSAAFRRISSSSWIGTTAPSRTSKKPGSNSSTSSASARTSTSRTSERGRIRIAPSETFPTPLSVAVLVVYPLPPQSSRPFAPSLVNPP